MDYADSQSGLRSVSTSIPRYTGMERGGAINLVFDDSVSTLIQYVRTYTARAVTYDGRGVAFSGDLHTFTLLYWSEIQKTRRVRGDYLVPTVGGIRVMVSSRQIAFAWCVYHANDPPLDKTKILAWGCV